MPELEPTADCYSAGERAAMGWGQRARAILLGPLLNLLVAGRVSPDAITGLSLVAGLAFFPLAFYAPFWALVALALHVFLDGLDGPLARRLGTASRRGSFTDTASDQCVVAATTIAMMRLGKIGVEAGGVYLFVYTLVVAFAMVRNALGIPYSWVVRPRFIVYFFMACEFYNFWPGTLDLVVWICNGALLFKLVTGFLGIRRAL